jgi:predicted RNA-binding protein with PUA-like domain
MARWLFKIEPDCYSYADLERDGETVWDGVANPLAKKHLRAAKVGDEVLYYHTGKEKAIVGIATVSEAPTEADDGAVSLKVKPVRKLANPVTLTAIKAEKAFAEWELVRQGRLSVMPVSVAVWKRVEELAKK